MGDDTWRRTPSDKEPKPEPKRWLTADERPACSPMTYVTDEGQGCTLIMQVPYFGSIFLRTIEDPYDVGVSLHS